MLHASHLYAAAHVIAPCAVTRTSVRNVPSRRYYLPTVVFGNVTRCGGYSYPTPPHRLTPPPRPVRPRRYTVIDTDLPCHVFAVMSRTGGVSRDRGLPLRRQTHRDRVYRGGLSREVCRTELKRQTTIGKRTTIIPNEFETVRQNAVWGNETVRPNNNLCILGACSSSTREISIRETYSVQRVTLVSIPLMCSIDGCKYWLYYYEPILYRRVTIHGWHEKSRYSCQSVAISLLTSRT